MVDVCMPFLKAVMGSILVKNRGQKDIKTAATINTNVDELTMLGRIARKR